MASVLHIATRRMGEPGAASSTRVAPSLLDGIVVNLSSQKLSKREGYPSVWVFLCEAKVDSYRSFCHGLALFLLSLCRLMMSVVEVGS
eukprot:154317-Amphidinium_carterae.1